MSTTTSFIPIVPDAFQHGHPFDTFDGPTMIVSSLAHATKSPRIGLNAWHGIVEVARAADSTGRCRTDNGWRTRR